MGVLHGFTLPNYHQHFLWQSLPDGMSESFQIMPLLALRITSNGGTDVWYPQLFQGKGLATKCQNITAMENQQPTIAWRQEIHTRKAQRRIPYPKSEHVFRHLYQMFAMWMCLFTICVSCVAGTSDLFECFFFFLGCVFSIDRNILQSRAFTWFAVWNLAKFMKLYTMIYIYIYIYIYIFLFIYLLCNY